MKKIKDWSDLVGLENENYKIEVNLEGGNGWIKPKNNKDEFGYYLSTHTFYEMWYEGSTKVLQSYGFDVELESWGR